MTKAQGLPAVKGINVGIHQIAGFVALKFVLGVKAQPLGELAVQHQARTANVKAVIRPLAFQVVAVIDVQHPTQSQRHVPFRHRPDSKAVRMSGL